MLIAAPSINIQNIPSLQGCFDLYYDNINVPRIMNVIITKYINKNKTFIYVLSEGAHDRKKKIKY